MQVEVEVEQVIVQAVVMVRPVEQVEVAQVLVLVLLTQLLVQ